MLDLRPDIMILDHQGQPIATVEVSGRERLSPELATTLRRNMIAHGFVPITRYFLFITQDVGYVWKDAAPGHLDLPPDSQFALTSVIDHYLGASPKRHLGEAELQLVLAQWLILLTLGQADLTQEPARVLAQVGFDEAIRGGRIEFGDAA